MNGGVYQVSVPRAEKIKDGDFEVPPSMGLGTAINGGIEVTSLHNHLLNEQPRLFFMHFWANDTAVKLARTLRAALDKTNSKKP